MLARGGPVAVDSQRSPHAAPGHAADGVGAQDEPPSAPFGTIEYAPLPAGIGGQIGAQVGPACLDSRREDGASELLVDAIVADTDTETKGLWWRAIAAGLERDAGGKGTSPRHGQNVDESAGRARPNGGLRLASDLDIGDIERGARRSRLGVPEVAYEVHDSNRRRVGRRARRQRQCERGEGRDDRPPQAAIEFGRMMRRETRLWPGLRR